MRLSDTCYVHPGARIAEDVEIGEYTVIGEHVEIGQGSRIGHHVSITGNTRIGENNEIHPMAVIGGPPQDLKFRGEASRLVIGDRNTIREFVTIHTGTEQGGGVTVIGNDCLLMAYVHVAHDCILRDRVVLSNSAELAGHVLLEEGVVIGGKTGVHHFVTIGRGAFVGGMSAVRLDIAPYMVAEGIPARVRGINTIGLRRGNHTREALDAVKEAFRLLFRSDLNFCDAAEKLTDLANRIEEVGHIVESMREMEKGRCGRARESTRIFPALS